MSLIVLLAVLAVLPWWLARQPLPRDPAYGRGTWPRRGPARSPALHRRRRSGTADGITHDPAVLLDLVDVALAAGASIPDALHGLGTALGRTPTAADLAAASTALRLGASWPEAWSGRAPVLHPLAAALEPAWLDGADPGPLVRRAAAGVRARRQRAAREAAERLGARLVLPLGLCFLPAFVLLSLVPVLLSGGSSLLGG